MEPPVAPIAPVGPTEVNPDDVLNPDDLISWHLYADPDITEEPTEGLQPAIEPSQALGSGLQQQRPEPQAGSKNVLHEYIWDHSHTFMPRVASLHAQYLLLRNCIYYGAPKLKKVNLHVFSRAEEAHIPAETVSKVSGY
jgi:hypothetical protein